MTVSEFATVESAAIISELNPDLAAKIMKDVLQNPIQSRGLAKLLMAFSAVRYMSGVKDKKGDPYLAVAQEVLAMSEATRRRLKDEAL